MEKSNISIKQICELLWEFEKETNSLDLEIQGVKFYELIRFDIFEEITKKMGLYGTAHTPKNSTKDKIKVIPRICINSIFKNPLRGKYKKQILVFDHPRKLKINGFYVDIYTHYFIKKLDVNKYEIIEKPHMWKHYTKLNDKNRKYTDSIILNTFIKVTFFQKPLSKNELAILEYIENKILEKFNIKINIIGLTKKKLGDFKAQFQYYDKLFKKRKPTKVYLVVSYMRSSIIAAAKHNNIKVVEFQHGVITNYHFAYNFSNPTKKLEYFPDKLLTFGNYWARTKRFPKQTKIESYGFEYMNNQLKKYERVPKKRKQVLFISQGTIGMQLSKHAKKLAENLPEYHFIFKLHPGEYDRWKSEYTELVEGSELNNLEIIDHNENLYKLFAESEYQMGVYSTAIFEGLALNCKTILFALPGIEYMQDLIDRNIVEVANNTEEAIRYINNFETKNFPKDHFFKDPNK